MPSPLLSPLFTKHGLDCFCLLLVLNGADFSIFKLHQNQICFMMTEIPLNRHRSASFVHSPEHVAVVHFVFVHKVKRMF